MERYDVFGLYRIYALERRGLEVSGDGNGAEPSATDKVLVLASNAVQRSLDVSFMCEQTSVRDFEVSVDKS